MKQRQTSRIFNLVMMVMAGVMIFLIGVMVGDSPDSSYAVVEGGAVTGVGETPSYLDREVDFDLFWDTWELISQHYVDQPVSQTQLLYGAIDGLVNSLEDPHSLFLTPEVNEDFLQELSGSFFGVGAEIAIKNKQLQIVAPLPDTPAERAGLRPGDLILKIDDLDTAGVSIDYAVSKIRGPKGTSVVLTIYREGEDQPREVTIVRDEIKITSVSWKMLEGNIAYIELRYFNGDTASEFKRMAKEIVTQNPDHIILDMRNNPGGFLDAAIQIASQFIEEGTIVSEQSFDGTVIESPAVGKAVLAGYPVTVLINEGSASASEIVAGALKDYNVATVIGMQSFGKGSVQTLYDLPDGSSVKLTIAKWLTPSGATIEGEGITPDIIVDLTLEDWNENRDPQLERALERARE